MKLTISKILKATSGNLISGSKDTEIKGLSIDSRKVSPEDLFIPLKGEHCDGNEFVKKALQNGAIASLIQKGHSFPEDSTCALPGKAVIEVEDPLTSLGSIAAYWRSKFNIQLVAITGSNGKTTTKELAWHIISKKLPCKKIPATGIIS